MGVSCVDVDEQIEKASLAPSKQKTLKKAVSISGTGLFTAEKTTLTIHPASPNTGLVFQRSDLPNHPIIQADLKHVISTLRCTVLGTKQCSIHTVEHVLAALEGMRIDNALLEVSGPEIPIMDGSANSFVQMISEGEIMEQAEEKEVHFLQKPRSWSDGDVHLIAIPSEEFSISYTLHYPQSQVLGSQYFQTVVTPKTFSKEIASCRTFCLYEDILPFIENGLIKGGGVENAVIIKNDVIVNAEGVRFHDEMVRHKILDLLGDISLIPMKFVAHIIAVRSGHTSNIAFARELYNQIKMEKN